LELKNDVIQIANYYTFYGSFNVVAAVAIYFTAPESWGKIEPVMIGHYTKKNSSDDSELPHIVDIECFLHKPYPAIIQVWYV
jgi:hypothetical protein